jgi:hypothetical protein
MAIEWDELPQREALEELARGIKWRRELKAKLDALDQAEEQPRGRGRPRSNGSEFPEHARGALDTAGEA